MKLFKIFSILSISIAIANSSFAQTQTETLAVSGNCGMCKTSIEKAAKSAGATTAEWNVDTKALTVSYASAKASLASIQQSVAAAGYDTRDVKAADAAYDKLHACCKYERTKKTETKPASDKKENAACCSKEEAGKDSKSKACCSESH